MRSLACIGLCLAVVPASGCSADDPPGRSNPGGTGGNNGTGGTSNTGGSQSGTGGSAGEGTGGSDGTGGQGGSTTPDGGDTEAGAGGSSGGSMGSHSKMLKLDTTPAGANVTGDVPKYPVPVVLTAANFDFTQAKTKGEDIRFTTEAGAALPYSIELWDPAAKIAALWVKVDVKGNSTQSIKMTWGDSAATDASDSHAVFDTKDGFLGVWHLSEPGSTTAGGYKDATASGADGDGIAMTADATGDGRVGKAALLANAKKQWIQIPVAKSTIFDMPDKMTYSLWVNAKSHTVSYQCMFSKGEKSFRIHYVGTEFVVETCAEGTQQGDLCPVNPNGTKVQPGSWFHLLAIHDHPRHAIYVNGVLQEEANDDEPWVSDPTKPVMIGNNSSATGRAFDGFVDEARIMNVPKDDNWIKLEFESQKEGQKFVTFGAGT
jgi:hypothetical protein